MSHLAAHLRVGWANTAGYVPYPGGGEKWGGNGVGDDLFSYGFDGRHLWTGGRETTVFETVGVGGQERVCYLLVTAQLRYTSSINGYHSSQ